MKKILALMLTLLTLTGVDARSIYDMSDYGIRPGRKADSTAPLSKALARIAAATGKTDVTLRFEPGVYHFYPEKAVSKTYFISNHDQTPTKTVGIDLDGWDSLTIEGSGAEFVFHGRMLPIALVNSTGCRIENLSIDFADPQIFQVTIVAKGDDGIIFRPDNAATETRAAIVKGHSFVVKGHGWEMSPRSGIAFEPDTRHIVYRSSDIGAPLDSVIALKDGTFRAPAWRNAALRPGIKVALRSWQRPHPGIFMSYDRATTLKDVTVHYAEGMGLLAQLCDGIEMEGFRVALRGDDDPRYFTTQADATHFSGCKGEIKSVGGLYEGMMDDAINVHGTYLKITERLDDRTVIGRYVHSQSYGFMWGEAGDTVGFVASRTMDLTGASAVIASIEPYDKTEIAGAKLMKVTFTGPLPEEINPEASCGMENLTWTPSVTFSGNTIRNNRARGSLFSTPRRVIVTDNLFDHTSGSAILLCGDCNGWYETGACRDVTIRSNRFINALTSMFQFTEAVISIYPEIPDLAGQKGYFHSGIVIEDNTFETFDTPLLYAKSVDGLTFRGNSANHSDTFAPYHRNRFNIKLERVRGTVIENNDIPDPSISVN